MDQGPKKLSTGDERVSWWPENLFQQKCAEFTQREAAVLRKQAYRETLRQLWEGDQSVRSSLLTPPNQGRGGDPGDVVTGEQEPSWMASIPGAVLQTPGPTIHHHKSHSWHLQAIAMTQPSDLVVFCGTWGPRILNPFTAKGELCPIIRFAGQLSANVLPKLARSSGLPEAPPAAKGPGAPPAQRGRLRKRQEMEKSVGEEGEPGATSESRRVGKGDGSTALLHAGWRRLSHKPCSASTGIACILGSCSLGNIYMVRDRKSLQGNSFRGKWEHVPNCIVPQNDFPS